MPNASGIFWMLSWEECHKDSRWNIQERWQIGHLLIFVGHGLQVPSKYVYRSSQQFICQASERCALRRLLPWAHTTHGCERRRVRDAGGHTASQYGSKKTEYRLSFHSLESGGSAHATWTIHCLLFAAGCVDGVRAVALCSAMAFAWLCPDHRGWTVRWCKQKQQTSV